MGGLSIIYRETCTESQSFGQHAQVKIHTCVKLELTACELGITLGKIVGKNIGGINLRTGEEITVTDIVRTVYQTQ